MLQRIYNNYYGLEMPFKNGWETNLELNNLGCRTTIFGIYSLFWIEWYIKMFELWDEWSTE